MGLYELGLNKNDFLDRKTTNFSTEKKQFSQRFTTQPRNVTTRQARKGANEKDIKMVDRYKYKFKHNTNRKSNTYSYTNTNIWKDDTAGWPMDNTVCLVQLESTAESQKIKIKQIYIFAVLHDFQPTMQIVMQKKTQLQIWMPMKLQIQIQRISYNRELKEVTREDWSKKMEPSASLHRYHFVFVQRYYWEFVFIKGIICYHLFYE